MPFTFIVTKGLDFDLTFLMPAYPTKGKNRKEKSKDGST